MSNSSLVNYTKLSPNCSKPRNQAITKITIHHMAGNLTVERCGELFANKNRSASSNYGIGSDGRIGLYVEEANRSWCSGNADNDNKAITIEVANDGGAPDWHVSDKAYESLINLCVDICQRNGIKALHFTGDANGNLTQHNYFQATACPGPYLKSRFVDIANMVNERLGQAPSIPQTVDVSGYPVIKKGSTGGYVTQLQTRLVELGYDPNGIDGIFGPGCNKAVKKFQKEHTEVGSTKKLVVDGCVGPKTWAALYN